MAPFFKIANARGRVALLLVVAGFGLLQGTTVPAPAAAASAQVNGSQRIRPVSPPAPATSGQLPLAAIVVKTPAAKAVPTPKPAAVVTKPAAKPAAQPAAKPALAAATRNRLISADGTLNTGVSTYSDCSGRTGLTHATAAIDTCIRGRIYFVGHNPGVFTPLFHLGVGAVITWYDRNGAVHGLRIVTVRTWHSGGYPPSPINGGTVQMQTCITLDGSVDRLVDLAPA